MLSVLQETAGWAWQYVQHVVFMFYWAWVPGALGAAFLGAWYRQRLEEMTLKRQPATAAWLAALGWGMLSGVGRRASLATAERLWEQGVSTRVVLAYLVASHNLGLYLLLLFTLLIGIEFGLGLFLGGLVMAGLLYPVMPVIGPERLGYRSLDTNEGPAPRNRESPPSPHGSWGALYREAARPLRYLSGSLLGGLIVGAAILAIDNHGHWLLPKWMGDEGLGPALAASFLVPFLSVILFLAPGGNLFVASSIWKTWTLAYPGALSFVLMSLLNPLTIRAFLRRYGRRRGWLLAVAIYFAAALSGLLVAALFALLGLEVTHIPWVRDLVDRIITTLPFTMLGAPRGGMKGM